MGSCMRGRFELSTEECRFFRPPPQLVKPQCREHISRCTYLTGALISYWAEKLNLWFFFNIPAPMVLVLIRCLKCPFWLMVDVYSTLYSKIVLLTCIASAIFLFDLWNVDNTRWQTLLFNTCKVQHSMSVT